MELFKTAASLKTSKLSFGCPILDRVFGGGVPIGSITEVTGESGSGKTQLMLQLALHTQFPEALGGQSANSLFLNTELSFPIKQLHQMAANNPFLAENPLDKVFVHSIPTLDDLLSIIARLDSYLSSANIKLIVVDSITALFRSEFNFNGHDMARRQQIFFHISEKLRFYANKYSLAVVLTNQVVDSIPSLSQVRIGNDVALRSSDRLVNPALGLSWANCVNSRFVILKRNSDSSPNRQPANSSRPSRKPASREMQVVFAPHIGEAICDVEINKDGIFGLE